LDGGGKAAILATFVPLVPGREAMAEFVRAGTLGEFAPGSVTEREVAGRRVVLVNLGGTLYAVSNLCPHVSLPLAGGFVVDDTLVCPFHGSTFELATGECIQGPAAGDALDTYEVRVEGNDVLIAVPSS
jgi:nitrite reductase/ring-hydroxylating ferredoxin subunit